MKEFFKDTFKIDVKGLSQNNKKQLITACLLITLIPSFTLYKTALEIKKIEQNTHLLSQHTASSLGLYLSKTLKNETISLNAIEKNLQKAKTTKNYSIENIYINNTQDGVHMRIKGVHHLNMIPFMKAFPKAFTLNHYHSLKREPIEITFVLDTTMSEAHWFKDKQTREQLNAMLDYYQALSSAPLRISLIPFSDNINLPKQMALVR